MQAYRFKDEKSDKFWRIEYAGDAYAVNYGKAGTTGK
jgi:predicted DNA-binding WGR domain protein